VNISAGEITLLLILALVIFGPKRLPEIGRQVGRALAELRRMSREFEEEVREVADPFVREVRDAAEPLEREVREAERVAREQYALDDDHSSFIVKEPPTKE
jgi:TatA/E family protein of Tat protein translocase